MCWMKMKCDTYDSGMFFYISFSCSDLHLCFSPSYVSHDSCSRSINHYNYSVLSMLSDTSLCTLKGCPLLLVWNWQLLKYLIQGKNESIFGLDCVQKYNVHPLKCVLENPIVSFQYNLHLVLRSAVGMTHSLRSDLWWTIPLRILLGQFWDTSWIPADQVCLSHFGESLVIRLY